MADKISKNRAGLAVGLFVALVHAIWALIIWIAPKAMQDYLDWIFPMHFLTNVFSITAFNLTYALTLVLMAFVGGYVFGWLYAVIWDWLVLKKVK
jgi:hypothetical protein